MIHTVTLNPVIDLIYCIESFEKGTTFRCDDYTFIPAGKGINVSYALACMGVTSHACLVLGENDTSPYVNACNQRGIELSLIAGHFRIRRHCTILETGLGSVTHAQTKGEEIPDGLVHDLIYDLYCRIRPGDIVVLSGSVPPGIPDTIYCDIIEECKKKQVSVILDTSGEPLSRGIQCTPDMIKANKKEAEVILGHPLSDEQDECEWVKEIHRFSKVPTVVISLGERGLLAGCDEGIWKLNVPMKSSEVFDTVGCGDAMVGGLVYGWYHGLKPYDAFCQAVAWASAAALQIGPANLLADDVRTMLQRVLSQRIGEW